MFKKLIIFFTFVWAAGCYAKIVPEYNTSEKYLIHGGYMPENDRYSKFAVSIAHVDRSVQKNDDDDSVVYGHFCAGTIIGLRTILTSAFCLKKYKAQDIVVIAGTPELTKKPTSKQIVKVERTIMHPQYQKNNNKSPHDIGIMHLSRKLILFRDRVDVYRNFPCTLPEPGSECTLIGWGVSENSSWELTEKIRYIDLVVLKKKQCAELLAPISNTYCAKGIWGKPGGGCVGDSGGPFFCNGYLNGINYYTMDDFIRCDTTNPTYFVDITQYIDWIKENSADFVALRSAASEKQYENVHIKIINIIIFVVLYKLALFK